MDTKRQSSGEVEIPAVKQDGSELSPSFRFKSKNVETSILIRESKIETLMDWIKFQFVTLNLANVALLITVLIVSADVNSNLASQRAENESSRVYVTQIQQLKADITAMETSINNARAQALQYYSSTVGVIQVQEDFFTTKGYSNFSTLVDQYVYFAEMTASLNASVSVLGGSLTSLNQSLMTLQQQTSASDSNQVNSINQLNTTFSPLIPALTAVNQSLSNLQQSTNNANTNLVNSINQINSTVFPLSQEFNSIPGNPVIKQHYFKTGIGTVLLCFGYISTGVSGDPMTSYTPVIVQQTSLFTNPAKTCQPTTNNCMHIYWSTSESNWKLYYSSSGPTNLDSGDHVWRAIGHCASGPFCIMCFESYPI